MTDAELQTEWRHEYETRLALATESGREATQADLDRAAETANRHIARLKEN